MKKAVVTGGGGFIGSHITDALVDEGFEVHVIDTFVGGKREHVHPNAIVHEIDVRDFDGVVPVVAHAEVVIHAAALPRVQYSIEQPLESHSVNVDGTLNVLAAAVEGRVRRVVYSASSSVYGDQKRLPLSEDTPPAPQSPYGLQKYMGELLCRTWSNIYRLETVSLRYFNVYGPRLDPEGAYALVIGKFLKQRSEGKPMTITGDGTHTRDFTHVRDVVSANLRAIENTKVGKGEVINIGAGKECSINNLAQLIGGPVTYIAPRLEPAHTRADATRARKLLGWKPEVSLEEGIAELKREWKLP